MFSKAIKSLLVLSLLASTANAGKSKTQYDVCAIDGGKLGVYEVTEKRAEAMVLAKYLTQKNHRAFFVVIEVIDAKTGDVK